LVEYYFDIETTGCDKFRHKIITIQYQRLNGFTGQPFGDLAILKEWESSEKDILAKFIPIFIGEKPFDFIPVGDNLSFDFEFMRVKSEKYGLSKLEIDYLYHDKPTIDLTPILIMVNKGSFKGYDRVWKSGLGAKGLRNELVPQWYESKQYDKIIEYITAERDAFASVYMILKREMPKFTELMK